MILSDWTECDWQEANQTRRPQLMHFFESNFSTFSESPPISAHASAAHVATSSDTKPSSSDATAVAPSAAKSAKSSHEKQREDDKKRELASFLKLVFPSITVPSSKELSDEEKQQNKLVNQKRTKITDLLGLLEHKKNTGKEKKENQATGGGGGATAVVHPLPFAGSPARAPVSDDRKHYAVVALLQQLGLSHLIPKFKSDAPSVFKMNFKAYHDPTF